nr:hypothetical protein [Enterococcus faecalis]UZP83247.1 hypothetical protein [Enterococcus faecalis]
MFIITHSLQEERRTPFFFPARLNGGGGGSLARWKKRSFLDF